jgi:hypothetical protein
MKAPEDEFVYNWLAEVATEQPAKTPYPAGDSYGNWLLPQPFVGVLTLLFVQRALRPFCLRHGGSHMLLSEDTMRLSQPKETAEKKGVIPQTRH